MGAGAKSGLFERRVKLSLGRAGLVCDTWLTVSVDVRSIIQY